MIVNFLKNKFVKDNTIYVTGVLLVGILGYMFHFLVSRNLSVSEYGELQSLLAVYSILAVFGSALSYFVIKHSSVFSKFKDYEANKNFTDFINKKLKKIAIILFILFILISPWLYKLLHLSNFWGLFFIITATFITLEFSVYYGELNAWEEFFSSNAILFAGAVVKLITGFLFAFLFANASMVAISILTSSLITWFLAQYVVSKKLLKIQQVVAEKSWREYFPKINFKKIILPTFIFSILYTLTINLDIILVKSLTTSEITGYYSALSLLGKIIFWVNSAIIAVILPKAYAAGHEGKRVNKKTILQAYGLIFLVGILGILLYFLFPKIIITLLFGSKYAIFVNTLWLFALMALILSLLALEANFSYAKHDFRISYVLAMTAFLMIFGIYFFHHNIQEMILAINTSFLLGYLVALSMNTLLKIPLNSEAEEKIITT